MGLSGYETSYHLTTILMLVLSAGGVLGGVALACGWSWLRRHWTLAGPARRHRWDRVRPVGTVGRVG